MKRQYSVKSKSFVENINSAFKRAVGTQHKDPYLWYGSDNFDFILQSFNPSGVEIR